MVSYGMKELEIPNSEIALQITILGVFSAGIISKKWINVSFKQNSQKKKKKKKKKKKNNHWLRKY